MTALRAKPRANAVSARGVVARGGGAPGERIEALDWPRIEAELEERGATTTGVVLTPEECAALVQGYDADAAFRSRVVMARHGYGRGEYKYFAYPLPEPVAVTHAAVVSVPRILAPPDSASLIYNTSQRIRI